MNRKAPRNLIMVLVTPLVCAFSIVAHAGELVYVHSKQAKMLAAPDFNAAPVATLDKGSALEVQGKDGRWLKVSHQQQTGWVPELLVGAKPPLDKISVINEEAPELKESARRRASATTSTAAARGLRNDDRARESDDAVADYSALTEMEGYAVSDEEARKFVDEGVKE